MSERDVKGGGEVIEQRAFWSKGQLEKRAGVDQRRGERRAKVYDASRNIWEYPRNEESVLDEIRLRMQSAGSKVMRVRERIPKTSCPRCHAPVWVGKHSDSGHPDLHGFFSPAAWLKLSGQETRWPVAWFSEVKREKGGVKRVSQIAEIEDIERLGGIANFANSWGTWCDYFKTRTGVDLPRA